MNSGVAQTIVCQLLTQLMATVAEQLQMAREAKSLTIYQVADTTKIRTDHIRALESGDFNAFSAPVYIRGFVRTYAGLLKLDINQIMAALDAELGQTKKFREHPPLTDRPRGVLDFITYQLSKVNWRAARVAIAVVIVLAICAGGLVAWRYRQKPDPIGNLKPNVYQPAKPSSGEILPVPPAKKTP